MSCNKCKKKSCNCNRKVTPSRDSCAPSCYVPSYLCDDGVLDPLCLIRQHDSLLMTNGLWWEKGESYEEFLQKSYIYSICPTCITAGSQCVSVPLVVVSWSNGIVVEWKKPTLSLASGWQIITYDVNINNVTTNTPNLYTVPSANAPILYPSGLTYVSGHVYEIWITTNTLKTTPPIGTASCFSARKRIIIP